MRTTMTKVTAGLAVVGALAAVGCGGGGDDEVASTAAPPAPSIEQQNRAVKEAARLERKVERSAALAFVRASGMKKADCSGEPCYGWPESITAAELTDLLSGPEDLQYATGYEQILRSPQGTYAYVLDEEGDETPHVDQIERGLAAAEKVANAVYARAGRAPGE